MKTSITKNGIPYIEVNGYFLPDVALPEPDPRPIGIWGMRHEEYLRQHKYSTYITLLTTGKLDSYLADINEQANNMADRLSAQIARQEGITEQLKASNPLEWVRRMNSIRNRVSEIVCAELICT